MPNKCPPVAQDTCRMSVSPHTGKLVLGPTTGSLPAPSLPWPWEATGSPGRLLGAQGGYLPVLLGHHVEVWLLFSPNRGLGHLVEAVKLIVCLF